MTSGIQSTPRFAESAAEQPAHRVLIAGGGVAALETLLGLRALAGERVDLALLTPYEDFLHHPLAVLASFDSSAVIRIPFSEIASDLQVKLVPDALESVDAQARVVRTSSGRLTSYDTLVIAAGACPRPVVDGALTLGMPGASAQLVALLAQVEADTVERIAFVVPAGVVWTLPIYELALLMATYARNAHAGVKLAVVTAEPQPLQALGAGAGTLARELLVKHGIGLRTSSVVGGYEDGFLRIEHEGKLPVSGAVVALPHLEGPRIPGLPATPEGFLPIDDQGRVLGMDAIYAAGNVTSFPIMQSRLAAQQADAAAAHIAVRAGATVAPEEFEVVLGALRLNGRTSRFRRRREIAEPFATEVTDHAPWWPPARIVARHLSSYLAERARA